MAIAKRRKTTAAKKKPSAAKKRKAKVAAPASEKMKIGGLNFTKSSCHSKKTEAQKRAENVRAHGNRARVIKSGTAFCVYTGGKSKALARRAR